MSLTKDERLFLKFKHLVREVEKRLSYKLDIVTDKNIEDMDYTDISPLKLVYPEYLDNQYLNLLVAKIYTIFPKEGTESWISKCEGSNTFLNQQKRMVMAGFYMQLHTFKRGHFVSFIFWSMLALVIHKENYADHLSLIIDFSRIFGMSTEELVEITEIVKAFFGDPTEGYELKSKEIKDLFGSTYTYLITQY